jgi:hypothetical protein
MKNWIDITTGKEVDSIAQIPKGAIGFTYIIKMYDGRKYIGKKNLRTKRKRKFGKKEVAKITDKRKKHWEYVIKESNWKTYVSSNKKLQKEIEDGLKYEKYILEYAYSKKELTYKEEKQLYVNEVLEQDNWINDNIGGRFFRKDIIKL